MTEQASHQVSDADEVGIFAGQKRDEIISAMTRAFASAGLSAPQLDARFLFEGTGHRERVLDEAGAEQFRLIVRRRLAGEPVDRILGNSEFWSLRFDLNRDTLVPRADTETLVETALSVLGEMKIEKPRLLDLGTGSGAILIALLRERPDATGVGLDLSESALAMARHNAERNGVALRADFVEGNWSADLAGPFDLIVSNPPYIPSADIAGLDVEVRTHDPLRALDGGEDGLEAYRAIAGDAGRIISPAGRIAFEIGAGQQDDVIQIMDMAGFVCTAKQQDLAGHVRVLVFMPVQR